MSVVATPLRVLSANSDTAQVWVRVEAWSPRRAFLTAAAPFTAAAGLTVPELAGRTFLADLDPAAVPGNEDTADEVLEWPRLVLVPEIPQQGGTVPQSLGAPVLSVRVLGLPAPQGSKTHKGGGVMVESSAYVRPWREAVVWAVRRATVRRRGWAPLDGPVEASMVFSFTRPKGHFGTGRNRGVLKPSAPARPDVTPDLSKLIRSTEDAITTAGGYRDDALIVSYRRAEKRYTTDFGRVSDVLDVQGAVIRLYRLDAPPGGGVR